MVPTARPSAQPTSGPTVYFAPATLNDQRDPFEGMGTNGRIFGMVAIGVCVLCCCVLGFLYWRRSRRKDEDTELSPYEKWMQNEDAKKGGSDMVWFANESNSAKFNLKGKDAERLQKLHTKHGVKMDREETVMKEQERARAQTAASAMRESEVNNPMRKSAAVDLGNLFGGGDDENFGGTWAEEDFINEDALSAGNPLSTHNPMLASDLDAARPSEAGHDAIYGSGEEFGYSNPLAGGMADVAAESETQPDDVERQL